MERRNLREARERRQLTQEDVADYVGVQDRATVSNWERGVSRPSYDARQKLYELFKCETPEEREALLMLVQTEEEKQAPSIEKSIELLTPDTVRDFLRHNLGNHLLCIADTSYRAPSEMAAAIRAVIKDFDMMNTGDATYAITRREALCMLAGLPMTTLGKRPSITTKHYTEMLMHCTAALEACWQLYRGSDPTGTQYAFERCGDYVPLLETIAHNLPAHQKEALDLATHYAILQTLLGWNCVGGKESVPYALKARDLSKETANILLQLSAYSKLNYTYLLSKDYTEAWKAMQEGAYVLRCYQKSSKKAPLPSGVIGNFNSSYAMVQADNGLDPDYALGVATDSEPLHDHVAFLEFTRFDQWNEAARACNSKGDPVRAMMYLGKLMDLETFAPRPGVPQHEGDRVSWINALTRSLFQLEKRDMGYIIKTWTADIEGAKALKSEYKFERTVNNFEIMKVLYPGEQAIRRLAPLTEHW